jgi:flagellar biosynthetic protein FliO
MHAGWFVDTAPWLVVAQAQSGAAGDPATLPAGTTGFGVQLFQSAIALVGVCFAAWAVLRWMARRGYGTGTNRNLRVIERVMLEPRRSVYLLEVGTRVFLVGSSDHSVSTLAELSRDDLASKPDASRESASNPAARFADVLSRIRRTQPTNARDVPSRPAATSDTGGE